MSKFGHHKHHHHHHHRMHMHTGRPGVRIGGPVAGIVGCVLALGILGFTGAIVAFALFFGH